MAYPIGSGVTTKTVLCSKNIYSDSVSSTYPRTKSVSDIILVYQPADSKPRQPMWINPSNLGHKLRTLPISLSKSLGATAPNIPRNSPKCVEMGIGVKDDLLDLPDLIIH